MKLIEASNSLIRRVTIDYKRFLYDEIDWNYRLIEILGARGVGKTTLMLQKAHEINIKRQESAVYASLDHPHFFKESLLDTIDSLVKEGVTTFFLDEVHKYPQKSPSHDWSLELKNIYDIYSDVKIVYSGSSILKLYKSLGDLSRRKISYQLPGLSFREFLVINKLLDSKAYSLEDILRSHIDIALDISSKIKPLPLMRDYLRNGYYPFQREAPEHYQDRIRSIITVVLESDIPAISEITFETISKIKRLLIMLSGNVPYTPKLTSLRNDLGISDQRTLLKYINLLDKANLICVLTKEAFGNQLLRKPDKIYLDNPNLMEALNSQTDTGTTRETFFLSQTRIAHDISYPVKGDFMIDQKYTFEVGGQKKTNKQIKDLANAYRALDGIETGFGNAIPLWLFGWLY